MSSCKGIQTRAPGLLFLSVMSDQGGSPAQVDSYIAHAHHSALQVSDQDLSTEDFERSERGLSWQRRQSGAWLFALNDATRS